MYKTVIFDLDGTLLDTLDDLTDAVNAALLKNNVATRSREEVCAFVGNGIKNLIKRALGSENQALLDVALQDFKEYYGQHCADKTQPYAGILQLLHILKEQGIATAVVSNKADFAVKKLAAEYFGDLLVEAVGENEEAGIRKKPAPDSLLSVMKNLNADPQTTVYVGDSEVDVQTAFNAHLPCICVTWGFRDRAFLAENGGEYFVDEPMEIAKLCGIKGEM